MSDDCPFCKAEPGPMIWQDEQVKAFYDTYPVSRGHALIVPHRHTPSFFELTGDEKTSILAALDMAKQAIDKEHRPDAYNIGINDGKEAGQTVPHLHLHVIPRYKGDVKDERGGIRWVLPERADYWSEDQ